MNAQFNEEITKATQGASMLLGDMRAAHSAACKSESAAGELALILLDSCLADSRQLADKLKRIQQATAGTADEPQVLAHLVDSADAIDAIVASGPCGARAALREINRRNRSAIAKATGQK